MQSFYSILGDEKIKQLVGAFYDRVYEHPVLQPIFRNTVRAEVEDKQIRFITQFLGGPMLYVQKYGPPKMRMRHLPHKITPKAKSAWLSCMKEAIQTLEITEEQKKALYECFPKLAQHMVNSYDD